MDIRDVPSVLTHVKRSIAGALILFACCTRLLPTEASRNATGPVTEAALMGSWTGEVVTHPVGEDWSPAVIVIDNSGGSLHGQVSPRIGRTRPLIFEQIADGFMIAVEDLRPGDECRNLGFVFTRATYRGDRAVELSGSLGGKCPNTIIGQSVRFTRV